MNLFISFFQTALHWAAKHGNEDVVKLIAGTRKADVNAKTVSAVTKQKKEEEEAELFEFKIVSILHTIFFMWRWLFISEFLLWNI